MWQFGPRAPQYTSKLFLKRKAPKNKQIMWQPGLDIPQNYLKRKKKTRNKQICGNSDHAAIYLKPILKRKTTEPQRRCLTKMKKRWNARLETGRWVFGSTRKPRLF